MTSDRHGRHPGPPPHAYPPAYWSPPTNGYAIASFVCGIVQMGIGSVLALVFGYLAKREIEASNGLQGGRGLAVAGIVLGWIGVGFLALVVISLLVMLLVAAATAG